MMAGPRSPHGAINTIDLKQLLDEALVVSGKIASMLQKE